MSDKKLEVGMVAIPLKIKFKFDKQKPIIQSREMVVHLSAKIPRLSKFWMGIMASVNCLILAFRSLFGIDA